MEDSREKFNEILRVKIFQDICEAFNDLAYKSGYKWCRSNPAVLQSEEFVATHKKILMDAGEAMKEAVNRFVDGQLEVHMNMITNQSASAKSKEPSQR